MVLVYIINEIFFYFRSIFLENGGMIDECLVEQGGR
jgi:hypothetical protein